MRGFSGRKILVTGATRGLGAAVASWLAQGGADVLGVGRTRPADGCIGVRVSQRDLTSRDGLSGLILQAKDFRPDTIIHAMGGGFGLSSDFITTDEFNYLLKVNFLASLEINNALVPLMVARKQGWVVHVGSVATRELTASVGYTCVKSLIAPYVKSMGRRLLVDSVYFSGITLGAITGCAGAIDRLHADRPAVFTNFIEHRRPSKRATPVNEILPYFGLLLKETARIHASNMIILDEAESVAI